MLDYLHVGNATDLTDSHDRRMYRFLEMLPGVLAWSTLALVVLISFKAPVFATFFIILFDIYWLIKTMYLSVLTRSSFLKMRQNIKVNWSDRLISLPENPKLKGVKTENIFNLVILPAYNEPYALVRESLHAIFRANYPKEKMIVVLATEARSGNHAVELARQAEAEFSNSFFKFIVTTHPANLPGELAGKGSNEAWAGQHVKKEVIDVLGIPYDRVLVSVFDIDTVVPNDFFACLVWHYLTASEPLRSSFQPIPIFTNNIWEAPAFARVFAFSTTFWQMIQQSRKEQMVTFSSHSVGFQALVDVGVWQKNVVSEDSRIYWQCLLRYDGDWQTVPMYYPIYMDANVGPTFWQTLKNQYKQIRRWHYGAENNPYFMFGFIKNKKIPREQKIHQTLIQIERTHSSPTNALIIFLLSWLPLWVGGLGFSTSILSYNLPRITSAIMNIALLGLVTSAIMSIILLPEKPPQYGKFKWLWMFLQWLLFPINFILFGAIPALDAQTRLLFGKYMGFWVTPKDRQKGARN
jgi:cellulose synthase/poly-beta-1,6-N-acetylglucosamine synthase-like glycosyltransferase